MTASRKTIAAILAAATLGLGVAGASTPAAAWGYYHPWGWGVGAAAAGLALGAAAAAASTSYYAPACYFSREPVVNPYGVVVGYRRIRVCN